MTGIPVFELPKTFQEAIEISRALHLRYLWIDSLCIVQNSESDWAAHVEAMESIYENAHITLAAGASADDDGGFFAVPHDRHVKPNRLELKFGDQSYNIYVRYCVVHPEAGSPDSKPLPLMTRGW